MQSSGVLTTEDTVLIEIFECYGIRVEIGAEVINRAAGILVVKSGGVDCEIDWKRFS